MRRSVAVIGVTVLGLAAVVAVAAPASATIPACSTSVEHHADHADPGSDVWLRCVPQYGLGRVRFDITSDASFPSDFASLDSNLVAATSSLDATATGNYFGESFRGAFADLHLDAPAPTDQHYSGRMAMPITHVASIDPDSLAGMCDGAQFLSAYSIHFAAVSTTFTQTAGGVPWTYQIVVPARDLKIAFSASGGQPDWSAPACVSDGHSTVFAPNRQDPTTWTVAVEHIFQVQDAASGQSDQLTISPFVEEIDGSSTVATQIGAFARSAPQSTGPTGTGSTGTGSTGTGSTGTGSTGTGSTGTTSAGTDTTGAGSTSMGTGAAGTGSTGTGSTGTGAAGTGTDASTGSTGVGTGPSGAGSSQGGSTTATTAGAGSTASVTVPAASTSGSTPPKVGLRLRFSIGNSTAEGLPFDVTGSGLEPGTTWVLVLHSTPRTLASGVVDASGRFSQRVKIPANTPGGSHRLDLTGTGADDSAQQTSAWFELTGAGGVISTSTTGPASQLAGTGASVDGTRWAAIVALLISAGVVLMLIARRRSVRAGRGSTAN